MRRFIILILASASFAILASSASAQDPVSIQLVGNFNGITCEPNDPANNMEPMSDHVWRKLTFINEPGTPDTIFFQFTRDGSYAPKHWGWSGVWGIAEFAYSPPEIAAILPDSGYYYFSFNHSDNTYWLERPAGSIHGTVRAENQSGVPSGTSVVLYDSLLHAIGTYDGFTDSTYLFDALCASVYRIAAHAPGYRDTTIDGIVLGMNESRDVPIHLTRKIGVLIASATCERVGGGVKITWCTMDCDGAAIFDVFRGYAPDLATMEKRNRDPVHSSGVYEFFDPCEDPTKDLYYYLVERGGDHPTQYGPLFVKGAATPAAMLGQNYPNPFNPSTAIPYSVSSAGAGKPVTISFYNVAGKLMDSHSLGIKQAGNYTFRWNPVLGNKNDFPSGVYYCRLHIDKETHTRTLVLLR
jgi:hypothetical protein